MFLWFFLGPFVGEEMRLYQPRLGIQQTTGLTSNPVNWVVVWGVTSNAFSWHEPVQRQRGKRGAVVGCEGMWRLQFAINERLLIIALPFLGCFNFHWNPTALGWNPWNSRLILAPFAMSIARENSSKVVDGGKGHRKGTDARYVIEISIGSSSTQFSFVFLNQSGKGKGGKKGEGDGVSLPWFCPSKCGCVDVVWDG